MEIFAPGVYDRQKCLRGAQRQCVRAFACRSPRAVVRVVIGCYTSRTYLPLRVCPAEHEIVFDNTVRDVRIYSESRVGISVVNSVVVDITVSCWLTRTSITSILNDPSAVCYDVVANCYAIEAVKRTG